MRAAEPSDTGRAQDDESWSRTTSRREELELSLIAIVVGIIAGLGAVWFRATIWIFQEVFFGDNLNPGNVEFTLTPFSNLFDLLGAFGDLRYIAIPAVGGLVVGGIIHFTTPEVKGHGVPRVLESMLIRGGRINPLIALYKTVASSIAIASGGSLGREGPIVQIGSTAGSYFSRFIDSKHARTLVAADAAGGDRGHVQRTPIGGDVRP